jgi:hypothetical protein
VNGRSFFARYSLFIAVSFAFLTPPLFQTAFWGLRRYTNKVEDWLPSSFAETGNLAWFRRHFVGDQFVVVSWEGCHLGGGPGEAGMAPDDPRIERLAQLLVPEPRVSAASASIGENSDRVPREFNDYRRYFKSVTTARRLLREMTAPPMSVPYDVAVRRLTGWLIGPDERQTCVVVTLTNTAVKEMRNVLGRGYSTFLRPQPKPGVLLRILPACGIDPATVHLGGPPVDNVAIDEEGERTLIRLASLSALLGLVLAWVSLRSFKLTIIVFTAGLLSASAGLAAVWLTGSTTDAVLLSMPSLVYVLAISGAIHLINYYYDAVQHGGLAGAPERAIAHGWKPALLCSVTTALGLLSLCTSSLVPIRKFGIYAALGVMLMLIILFVFLPAALQLFPIRPRRSGRNSEPNRGPFRHGELDLPRSVPQCELTSEGSSGYDRGGRFWDAIANQLIGRHAWVTAICMLIIGFVGFGVTHVRTSINLMELFDQHSPIVQDYRWYEARIGRLVPMEIVLRFDREARRNDAERAGDRAGLSLLARMEVVEEVQRAIEDHFGASGRDVVGSSMSAVTFVGPLPVERRGTRAIARRSATNAGLQESYDGLLASGYLGADTQDGAELWRISLRVAAFGGVDYGQFTDELRQVVDPIVRAHRFAGPRADEQMLSAVYTGVVPIVYKAQRSLLDSLIQSTFWSFVTITPLLMIVSRGVGAGLVAMLPNVLPVLVVFGGMGWLGLAVDIGSMMSASIALGVAVDDTIHFLTWFRDDLNRSGDRRAAIRAAYRRCGTPTLQAALINGLGLSVFAFSTFTPTRQFGYLMLTILLAGVVAELVLLPALLAGPLGVVFRPSGGRVRPRAALPSGTDFAHTASQRLAPKHPSLTNPSTKSRI